MQNYKKYAIPRAQLVIADVPYNVANNFYGSNPMWYVGGDNKNGESKLAGKAAFNSDFNFNLYEYFHFCSRMLKKEARCTLASHEGKLLSFFIRTFSHQSGSGTFQKPGLILCYPASLVSAKLASVCL